VTYDCTYCGHRFEHSEYFSREVECPHCNDKNTKALPESKKVDYYEGSIKERPPRGYNEWDEH
jgi:predicted  nucleic acid-binding Zn-ribbon protein